MAIRGDEARPDVRIPIPGPEAKRMVRRDEKHLVTTTKTAPFVAREGRGAVVEDVDGNVLLDFASGIGVLNTGHCHPLVVRAVQEQTARLMHFAGTDFYYAPQVELAERLGGLVPVKGATKTFFCQSGTEANEAAIKVAKHATARPLFLSFFGAFHGRTQGSLSLTASKIRQREGFFPTMPGVFHAPFPNPYRNPWRIDGYADPAELSNRAMEAIEGLFESVMPPQDTAAVFFEPVQGEGGYVVPPKMFPGMLRKLCDSHGIQLVADEVQSGFGRTGKWFASEHFGVQPDVMSLAKAMGSGFPIGATVVRKALDFDRTGRHSNTYGGNPVGCAAGLATIRAIEEEGMVENADRMGLHMAGRLTEMAEQHAGIGDHRGLGLMRAVEFVDAKGAPDAAMQKKVLEECWKRGLVLLGCGKSGIRLIPPLLVSEEQLDGGLDVVAEALKAAKT